MSGPRAASRLWLLLVLVGVLLGACAPPPVRTELPSGTAGSTPRPTLPAGEGSCGDATLSYPPATVDPDSDPTMRRIRERGILVVGVSADSVPLGYRDPLTGRLQGFDIDLAKAMAGRLLGSPQQVHYRVISADERIPLLRERKVDVVVRLMTIDCDRWTQVAFSQVYYEAGQKVLVRSQPGDPRPDTGLEDLAAERAKVCAASGTSSFNRLADPRYAGVVPVAASSHTGCLVLFQSGEVDAITGDDTVLAGLAQQDPYAVVSSAPKVSDEPYGIAFNAEDRAFVSWTNRLLDERVASGEWTASYERWLRASLGREDPPPTPRRYRS